MIAIKKNPLSVLSDSQLINRLDALVQKEREVTLKVLVHIIEMDRRKLYLGRGYGSLYEYCTLHLGYSESAAMRRIRTARCIKDYPEVFGMLEKNEFNLTSVSKIAGILNKENKEPLLKEARFKSSRHIEAMVTRHKPEHKIRDRVRMVFVKSIQEKPVKTKESNIDDREKAAKHVGDLSKSNSSNENWGKFTTGAGGKKLTTGASKHQQTSVLEKKFKIEFAVGPEFMKKLEETKALLSNKYPQGVPFERLFEVLMDEYINKHSPKRKIQRREKRFVKNKTKTDRAKHYKCNHSANKRSRHIPQAIQDQVFARDGGRCTFVGPNGRRCNKTWDLEIDHVKPFARGGGNNIHNLRLLCAKHNQYEAERVYGKRFMEQQRSKATPMRK